MLNFNVGNNGHGLKHVTCEQNLTRSTYSVIHQSTGSSVTGHSQICQRESAMHNGVERPFCTADCLLPDW